MPHFSDFKKSFTFSNFLQVVNKALYAKNCAIQIIESTIKSIYTYDKNDYSKHRCLKTFDKQTD